MKWPTSPLSQVARMVGGGTPSKNRPDFWCGDIPWVSPKDMAVWEIHSTEDHITKEAVAQSATQIVPGGSVLIVVRSGILVRRLPVAITGGPVSLNQDMKALIPHEPLLAKFLAYFLRMSEERILTHCVKRGATVHSIDVGRLEMLPVPVPAKSEQIRIVNMLDRGRALCEKCNQIDERVGRVIPALFYKMFGEPSTNPKAWRTSKLGDVIIETQYGTSLRASQDGGGTAVIRMNNIDRGGFLDLGKVKYVVLSKEELRRQVLRDGDLLFNRTNSADLVGKTGLWRDEMEAVPASYLIRVRVNSKEVVPEFVWAYMNSSFMKEMLFNKGRRAIGMANINAEELKAFPFFIPPLPLQKSFATELSMVRELRNHLVAGKRKTELLFSTLLYRAFSGDLTARWREAHTKELLAEMEEQTKLLNLPREALLC
jgi:type I restriction enzyme, S subunit